MHPDYLRYPVLRKGSVNNLLTYRWLLPIEEMLNGQASRA